MNETSQEAGGRSRPIFDRSTVWTFANSPLCLFLLSSVLISGVGALLQSRAENISAERQRAQNIEKLRSEIGFRISLIDPIMKDNFTYTAMYTATGALEGVSGNSDTDGDIIGYYSPIHDDFKNRSLGSLLWNLSDEMKKGNKENDIAQLAEETMEIRSALEENVTLIKPVVAGENSSIWSFSNPEIRKTVKDDVVRIKSTLNNSLDAIGIVSSKR